MAMANPRGGRQWPSTQRACSGRCGRNAFPGDEAGDEARDDAIDKAGDDADDDAPDDAGAAGAMPAIGSPLPVYINWLNTSIWLLPKGRSGGAAVHNNLASVTSVPKMVPRS